MDSAAKHLFAEGYKKLATIDKYKWNFVAVNERMGSDLVPVFNKLVMIAEMRAFEIQQVDYKDRFSVFNSLDQVADTEDLNECVSEFYSLDSIGRYKYLCSLPKDVALSILPQLPSIVQNYYIVLGPERIKALGYHITSMKKEYEGILGNQNIDIGEYIIKEFEIGKIYSKSEVKNKLRKLYDKVGYKETPRAVDLGNYFIIKNCMIRNKETGKRDNCYEIIEIKDKGD